MKALLAYLSNDANTGTLLLYAGIVGLALTAVLQSIRLYRSHRNARLDREQAFAPRSADSRADDSAVQGTACDMRPAAYARLVDEARRGAEL